MTHPDDTGWMQDAACAGRPADMWHPIGLDDPNEPKAKAICNVCPVQHQCLNWAIATNQTEGIWGGLNPRDRRHLDTNGMKQCATCNQTLPIDAFTRIGTSGLVRKHCKTCWHTRWNNPAKPRPDSCGHPDCTNEVPSHRTTYCSPECGNDIRRAKDRERHQRRHQHRRREAADA